MNATFSSLALPGYRRYFTGALTSNTGTWVGRTAVSWLVLMELTDGSASALGIVTAIMFTPQLVLSAYAGSITAALFLNRFVTRTKSFVHFDVAAWTDKPRPGHPVGAEAQCIRALFAVLRNRFGSKTA